MSQWASPLQQTALAHAQSCLFESVSVSFIPGREFILSRSDRQPIHDLNSSMAAFERLSELSSISNALRLVVMDIAPGIPQTSLMVEAQTNGSVIARRQMGEMKSPSYYFHTAPVTLISYLWRNQIPPRFQKQASYKMKALLLVRTEPLDEH